MDENKDLNKEKEPMKEEELTMGDLLGPEVKLEEGKIMNVRVIEKNADGILVDLGMKSEGIIPKAEFSSQEEMTEIKEGAMLDVVVLQKRSEFGSPLVSYKRILEKKSWEKIFESQKNNEPIEGAVRKKIKGGYSVNIGVDAFLPESQIDLRPSRDTKKYIGEKFKFAILEVNKEKRNVVLSRKKLLENEKKNKQNEVLANLFEGQILEGKVRSIVKFGAFVDIGGIDGLLHISDLAWYHVKKTEELLKVGQAISVKILKIDRVTGKISLDMKHMSPRPWEGAVEKYPEGLIVKGKIRSITDFGIFLEIEQGLEGLIHESEISWTDNGKSYKKTYSVGQEIEAKIISLDPENEKMALSIKRMTTNPWEEASNRYSPGTKTKATVVKILPFGATAKLQENVEGLIKISDMSWKKVQNPKDIVKAGDVIDVVVTEINPQNEKIALSIKHLTQDPLKKYKTGTVVKGKVKKITDFGAFVELEPGTDALLRASEIDFKKVENVSDVLKVGQIVEAKVSKADLRERKIDISIKKLEQSRERELVKKYSNKADVPTLGQILEEDIEEE
ncbi:S1 RNA-binding domain-containing protein [Elusimicrobiota bacterium]